MTYVFIIDLKSGTLFHHHLHYILTHNRLIETRDLVRVDHISVVYHPESEITGNITFRIMIIKLFMYLFLKLQIFN